MTKNLLLKGASIERSAILKKLKSVKKSSINYTPGVLAFADDIILWLLERKNRYNKKKGGLGK